MKTIKEQSTYEAIERMGMYRERKRVLGLIEKLQELYNCQQLIELKKRING